MPPRSFPSCVPEPGDRRSTDIVAGCQLPEGRTLGTSLTGLPLLLGRERSRTAHMLPTRLGSAPAFCRAGTDQIALHIGQSAQHGDR